MKGERMEREIIMELLQALIMLATLARMASLVEKSKACSVTLARLWAMPLRCASVSNS